MKAMWFRPSMLKSKPKRYRFIAVEENVVFGDEVQVNRFNTDADYAERTIQTRWVEVAAGDFCDAGAARWIADALNKAAGR